MSRSIGKNIREIRLAKGMKQTELVRRVHLAVVTLTRKTLVKFERGIQHIQLAQLRAIHDVLETTYAELMK